MVIEINPIHPLHTQLTNTLDCIVEETADRKFTADSVSCNENCLLVVWEHIQKPQQC